MFTGIVQGVARVLTLTDRPGLRSFRLQLPAGFATELAVGASVAVDGVCLTVTAVHPGDVFLLCTDGLWEYVDEAEMSASLSRASNPSDWLSRLEELVLRHANELGRTGHDNFSGIAVWVRAG